MIDLDYTLFVQAIVFIIFVFLINQFLFRPVIKALERRREATTGAQEKALDLQVKAEREAALLEEKLVQARQGAAMERDRIRKAMIEEQRAAIERAKRAIDTDIPAMREKVMGEAERVEENLKEELESFAKQIAERVLGRAA